MLTETKTWYEMKCLQQLEHGFLRALHGATDTVSTFSDATARDRAAAPTITTTSRRCGSAIRFFNNYLREAIKARNLRAVYDVFHQYRRLGARPRRPARAAARDRQALQLLRRRWRGSTAWCSRRSSRCSTSATSRGAPTSARRRPRPSCCATCLGAAAPHRRRRPLDGGQGEADPRRVLRRDTSSRPRPSSSARTCATSTRTSIERAEAELLAADRSFFEVTDRQLNLEYVPPERREPLRAFCAALQHRAAGSRAVAD